METCLQIPTDLKVENYFCQRLNVHDGNDVGQTEIHTAEPLAPELSSSEVEIAIEKLKVINHRVLIKFRQN
jgi:hypothetical protein